MSSNNFSQEKNMDEILASIRQTITRDLDPTMQTNGKLTGDGTSVARSQETREDILELTQVIQDDGTIIDLGEKNDMTEKESSREEIDALFESLQTQNPEINSDQKVKDADMEWGVHREAGKNIADDRKSDAFSSYEKVDHIDVSGSLQEGQNRPTFFSGVEEQIIDNRTIQESLSALSAFSRASNPSHQKIQDECQVSSQQTIDGMVRDLLRPMLKEWLDANLPSLVKWIVTEQVERLFREAKK